MQKKATEGGWRIFRFMEQYDSGEEDSEEFDDDKESCVSIDEELEEEEHNITNSELIYPELVK